MSCCQVGCGVMYWNVSFDAKEWELHLSQIFCPSVLCSHGELPITDMYCSWKQALKKGGHLYN